MISFLLTLSLNAQAMNLDEYRWKNRLLILKGSPESVEYKEALRVLKKEKSALEERKLIVIEINKDEAFSVELRGLDGGVKKRSHKFELDQILKLIDSMPMRQQELK